jgi:hypothetical protein
MQRTAHAPERVVPMVIEPRVLEGTYVRLDPLTSTVSTR